MIGRKIFTKRQTDDTTILKLMEELVDSELKYCNEVIDKNLLREYNKRLLQSKMYKYIPYKNKGHIVGFVLLHMEEGEICELYVQECSRGSGMGRILMRRAYRVFIGRGLDRAKINVNRHNITAYNLYKSEGFRDVSVEGDIIVLEKKL